MARVELLSKLVSGSECLNGVLEGGRAAKVPEMTDIVSDAAAACPGHGGALGAPSGSAGRDHGGSGDPRELFAAARILQSRHKSRTVTFSKKAFINVINLCRDICSYCTYKAEPGQSKSVMMSKRQIDLSLQMARRYGCIEALLVTGERPEERYEEARRWLEENEFESTADCLAYASRKALELGLFPHTNAGNLTRSEMAELRETNVSMGVMLETSSGRLASEPGEAHYLAPSKRPAARIAVLEDAGRLRIPMTTGILLGIGETVREAVESLGVIRDMHRRYGHIQEVIIQNFWPKPDTAMRRAPPADRAYFMAVVAACRIMMPDMNIQIPPNLSPDTYGEFLSVGINDWGGVSPLTPDYVNPEFPWPAIRRLKRDTEAAGYRLECRFPVYPEFAHMVPGRLRDMMSSVAQADGDGGGGAMLVKRELWE